MVKQLFMIVSAILVMAGCSESHEAGAGAADAAAEPKRGCARLCNEGPVVCNDFDCRDECSGTSICNCYAADGPEYCQSRGGYCQDEQCVTRDGATLDATIDAERKTADSAVDGGAADANPNATTAGKIACGTHDCDSSTHGCLASCVYATEERTPACIKVSDDGRWPRDDCPSGKEQFPRLWLQCDGSEDCPAGERCHMIYGSAGQYAVCGSCEEPCDLGFFRPLCRNAADCPTTFDCIEDVDLPGYSTCQKQTR